MSTKKDKDCRLDDPEHFTQVLSEFLKGDDRTVAILGAALVEESLEQTLRFQLAGDTKVVDSLFKPDRPLGTFGAKIDLCFAIGIIGKITYASLKKIKDVRNRFAHELLMLNDKKKLSGVSFRSKRMAELCHSIRFEGVGFDKSWAQERSLG